MAGNRWLKKSMADNGVLAGTPTLLGLTPFRSKLDALKDDIPHTMPQFQTAVFKLGQRTVVRLLSVAAVGSLCGVFQQGLCTEHFQNLTRIGLPVGGAVNVGAGFKRAANLAIKGV